MKKIALLVSMLTIVSVPSHAKWYWAIVNDPDGSANVRQTQNLNSKIVQTVANGTPLECSESNSDNRYCYIKLGKQGYIHKSRLEIFDEKSNFRPILLKTATPTKAVYDDNQTNVVIELEQKNLNPKDFSRIKYGYIYQGKLFYGTDNGLMYKDNTTEPLYTSHFFKNIQVTVNGRTLTVPKSEFSDLFIPDFFVNVKEALKFTWVFNNPKDNHLYIFSQQADGAGTYYVAFEFKNGKYHKRYVWNGE